MSESTRPSIVTFTGEYRFLSNFYQVPVVFEDATYPSVEHAFQAAKTLNPAMRAGVRVARTSAQAKFLGRRLALRPDWDGVKLDVMRTCLASKFSHQGLANQLIATDGQLLVEGNYWGDVYWGVCRGRGENWLGRLLMERRDVLLGRAR